VPKLGLALGAKTKLAQQEIIGNTKVTPSYWEARWNFGTRGKTTINGVGYLEMTGYDHALGKE